MIRTASCLLKELGNKSLTDEEVTSIIREIPSAVDVLMSDGEISGSEKGKLILELQAKISELEQIKRGQLEEVQVVIGQFKNNQKKLDHYQN